MSARAPKTALNAVHDLAFGQRNVSFPRRVQLLLTDRCNFACPMCSVGDAMKGRGYRDMDFELVERAVGESRKHGPMFELIGGEPTLYPRIEDAISLITKNDMLSFMVTNGLRLEKLAPTLVDAGLSVLQISLDGWDEESQFKRGLVPGSFAKIMDGIAAIRAARGKSSFPFIRIITTITKANFAHLDKIQKLLHDMNVEEWYLSNYYFVTGEVLNRHAQFREETGVGGKYVVGDPIGQGGYFEADEVTQLQASLAKIRENNERMGMRLSYHWSLDLKRYYSESVPGSKTSCTLPYTRVEVQTDGRVSTCIDGFTLGNIRENSIYDIWNGEKKDHLHSTLEQNWPMPMCFRCCGIADTITFDPVDSRTAAPSAAQPVTLSLL